MVNPHDAQSPHSRDWDDREREEERSLSRSSGGSDYTRSPTDYSRTNESSTDPYFSDTVPSPVYPSHAIIRVILFSILLK